MMLQQSLKLLTAVKSCVRDERNGANRAIRETWGEGLDNLRFIVGQRPNGDPPFHFPADVLQLACPDDYHGLPRKTRAILDFSLGAARDFTFLCDVDTFVRPDRLLASGFQQYDLTGMIGGNLEAGKYFPWPSGGAGYWLSRKAAQIVVNSPPSDEWAEDRMIGQILGPHITAAEITAFNHPGYHRVFRDDPLACDVTMHFDGKGRKKDYTPKWQYEMWNHNRER